MISYEKGGNIILSKGLPEVPVEDIGAFKRQSYEKFCKESVPVIIKEHYVPAINELLKPAGVKVDVIDVRVITTAPIPTHKHMQPSSQEYIRPKATQSYDCIVGKFQLYPASETEHVNYSSLNAMAEDVRICPLPEVTQDGLIVYDRMDLSDKKYKRHAYNFISQIELAPSISMGAKKEVTLRCQSGKSLIFYPTGNGQVHVRLDKKKHIPFAALAAYRLLLELKATGVKHSEAESIKTELLKSLHYYGLVKTNDNPYFEGYGVRREVSRLDASGKPVVGKRIDSKDLTEKVAPLFVGPNAIFTAKGLRGALNEYLSLYRAVGCISSKDIYGKDGNLIVARNEVITRSNIDEIYKNDIFTIHVVQETPVSVVTDEIIFITDIPKGTKNSPMLRRFIPEETGMYISQDYKLSANNCVAFPEKTEITKEIWQLLREVNYDRPISVKNTVSSKSSYKLYLDREIISNFCKPAGDSYEDWEYIGPFGKGSDGTDALTFGDMFALHSFLPQVLNNLYPGWLPDADACFLKRLTTINDMYSRALISTCDSFCKYMPAMVKHYVTNVTDLLQADTTTNRFFPIQQYFFNTLKETKCLEMVDEKVYVNPLAYESAKHKANVYVGNKHAIADDQRRMALNSYGRFDAYEVPQSGRLGIVNQLTTTCRLTEEGMPLVAYYPVRNMRVCFDEMTWLTAQQEATYTIADIGALELDVDRILNDPNEIVNCRVPSASSAKSSIEPQRIADVKFVNADPDCTLSYTCGSIPYSCSNDAIRATFAVAQIKEAKPTENTEPAGVTTTIMSRFEKMDNPFSLRAKEDGILVLPRTTECANHSYRLQYVSKDVNGGHYDKTYNGWADIGGAESLSRLKLVHPVGAAFKKGDVLMTSQFVNERGEICLGMDTLVAYDSDGYNYEDGVSIMPAFAERATSISLHAEEVYTGKDRYATPDIDFTRYYHKGDVINVKVTGKTHPHKHVLTVSGYPYVKTDYDDKSGSIKVKFLSVEPALVGDKFADRDGNKGVCTHIYGSMDNYTLANGYPIEVLRNPLGVATRLNIGQLKEIRLNWAHKVLGPRIELDNFSHDDKDIDLLVKLAYRLANSNSADEALAPIRSQLPDSIIELAYERYDDAQMWRGVFDEDGACDIYLNGEKRPTKVYAGFIHMLKLVQEVRSKIAYRGGEAEGERYLARTNAPTKGRKSSGGQRLGSMEVAAYCAYGAKSWLNELFSYRADDGCGRLAFAMDKYYGQNEYYAQESQRRSVTELVVSLAAMAIDIQGLDGELIDAMKLQHLNNTMYPKINALRQEMSFDKFNKPRKTRSPMQADKFEDSFISDAEMEKRQSDLFLVYPNFSTFFDESDPEHYNALVMLNVVCQGDEELKDKLLRTMRHKMEG